MRKLDPDPKFWRTAFVPFLGSFANLSKPNVLLAGDAAGIGPAFGGGIHLALSYGEVAAHSIIEAFGIGEFTYSDYRQKLCAHAMGNFLWRCTRLANDIYGHKRNPLRKIQEFHEKDSVNLDFLSVLLRIPRKN